MSSAPKRAAEYRATAAALYRQIERLEGDDPEDREAARVWLIQARHAEARAAEADRWATYSEESEGDR